jgi:hypothetical protein
MNQKTTKLIRAIANGDRQEYRTLKFEYQKLDRYERGMINSFRRSFIRAKKPQKTLVELFDV